MPYRVIVISGASSGIGRCFVQRLFQVNRGLVFFNLSRTTPERFSEGVDLRHRGTDLSVAVEVDEAAQWVLEQAGKAGPGQVLLVNNSGFGSYGHFPDPSVEDHVQMLGVNVTALVQLTGRLLPLLRERGGAILNVSSVAALQPTPYMATYGASKAFVLHWTLALRQELRGTGVRALALCPGPTRSNFFRRAGFRSPPMGGSESSGRPEDVVEDALQALAEDRALVIPGWRNRLLSIFMHPIPKTLQAAIAGSVLRKMRLERHKEGR